MARISHPAALIREHPILETDSPVVGVLAEGPVNDPVVLYRHSECQAESHVARSILGVIAIPRPHLATH